MSITGRIACFCGLSRDRIEVFRGEGKQPWHWRIVAGNGETLAHSEGHANKADTIETAKRIGMDHGFKVTIIE